MEKKDWKERLGELYTQEIISYKEFEDFISQELDKAREEGLRYALAEVQERAGVQNEEVYVLCNAILQESLILSNK